MLLMSVETDTGRDALVERMRRGGLRITRARKAIAAALATAETPLAMGEIELAAESEQIPRSTVYRVVNEMTAMGLLRRYEFDEGFARFEVADGFRDHHHHFVCRSCRQVLEIEGLGDLERQMGRAEAILEADRGLLIEGHRLDLFGLCASCARRSGSRR